MSDLKMNFDKLNKACKEVNEKWGNMMKENNPFDTISKIAKDIADRQDKEVALEFTKHICTLLKNNGVSPMIDEYRQNIVKENSVEQKYGVAITGLDFTEHDKRFRDEIMQLKSELSDVQKSADEYYNKCIDLTKQVTELESELETKDNLLKIKDGLCGNFNELPSEPISVANILINAKEEYEPTQLQKALFKTGEKCLSDKYSDDDLEQIAEHLLLYCKHNREDDEQ